ncbi:RNA polymerase sigma factor [Brevundimonas aurifodinae]|uniref:RNA polymerase sigma factor n=1 Tax=Brevundimonas aurifodinae TaxID=1508312 RepID=A0ABV1NL24_9CAUL
MLDDDHSLVLRVARGDEAAFAGLLGRHGPVMVRLAYRMLGDRAEAEDVAQEAFLRLWRKAPTWRDGPSGPGGWLQRVTMNLCLDRLRRRRFVVDGAAPEQVDPAASTIDQQSLIEARAQVAAAVGGLPARQRAALVLCYYEERSNAEAAAILGMSVSAVESLLARARRALRSILRAQGLETRDVMEAQP